MTQLATILWIDLEMTGLDPTHDRITEIAAIATDWEFKEIATYESGVSVSEAVLKERMLGEAAAFWEAHPQARDGVLAASRNGQSPDIVQAQLLEFMATHFAGDEPVLLGGNSIHQDRRFIRREWPDVDAALHYRMLDVSSFKVLFNGKYNKRFTKPEEHRALSDIRGSIEELKYYLKKVRL